MTNAYRVVQWNRHKLVYDAIMLGAVLLFLALFASLSFAFANDTPDPAVIAMRALGAAAFTLLHVTLCIGPLARLSPRFFPFLYNRRHMGVTVFALALFHGAIATVYYGAFGENPSPLAQVLFAGRSFTSIATFPFELLGFIALLGLFVMAATSHDFWLKNLSPRFWKYIHMRVYLAYALLVGHVALGSLQDQQGWLTPALLFAGAATVGGLHLIAAVREVAADSDPRAEPAPADSAWIRACSTADVPANRARVVCVPGAERVAIFRHDDTLSALTNVCAHQGGPLGEGRVVDGCVTCPWHGYQYRPDDGTSPPPYAEKIATYRLRVDGDDVYLDTRPLPPGTPVEPVRVNALPDDDALFEDVEKSRDLPLPRSGGAAGASPHTGPDDTPTRDTTDDGSAEP